MPPVDGFSNRHLKETVVVGMETRLSGKKEIVIGGGKQTVLIGERINPTGKKGLAEALQKGDWPYILREAREQVEAGADILDINVGAGGVDEAVLLPEVVRLVAGEVDAPLCLDSGNAAALEAALRVCDGKPLVNSVNGEEQSLRTILPLVKEYGAAVIALPMDEKGIPPDAAARVRIMDRIVEECLKTGIPFHDVVVDCLALSVGLDPGAALVTLETIREVKERFGLNITLGASNVSFSLPGRDVINAAFLTLAIAAGVTCPVVDAAKVRRHVLAADLVLGRDNYALQFIRYYRLNKDRF